MKKITLSLASLSALLLPVMALAINNPIVNPTGASVSSMQDIINRIINGTWVIFGGIAVIAFLIAGILFLTAGGDPEKIGKARMAFLWGVAGVIVGIIAYSIISIVGSIIG